MSLLALFCSSVLMVGADQATPDPGLQGGFVQPDAVNAQWKAGQWRDMLKKMRYAGMTTVIIQYLECRDESEAGQTESFIPGEPGAGDHDWVETILHDAENQDAAMHVFLGLRIDKRLESLDFLKKPDALAAALREDAKRTERLVKLLVTRYHLEKRRSFGGFYLPLELTNYRDQTRGSRGESSGWVGQLARHCKRLVVICKGASNAPVAISPYFNDCEDCASAEHTGRQFAELLVHSGISIVMLQDGVSVRNKQGPREIDEFVLPHLKSIHQALAADPAISLWLNVECEGATYKRLKHQINLGRGYVSCTVVFEFPHHMNGNSLYQDYVFDRGTVADHSSYAGRSDIEVSIRSFDPTGLQSPRTKVGRYYTVRVTFDKKVPNLPGWLIATIKG